jgi:predicted nucleic acid-binding protein
MNNRIRSDDLLHLSDLFLGWEALYRHLELLPQFRLVIDTNVILEDLLFLSRSRRKEAARTSLLEAIDSGAVVALAPFHLRDEVVEKIPILAAKEGVSEDALRLAWAEYQPRIKYVEMEEGTAEEAEAAIDPDDLPFVRLYRMVDADAVVSRDRHIQEMGAQSVNREALTHVRDYARAKAPEVVLMVGAMAVTIPPLAGLHALLKLSIKAVREFSSLPTWVQIALLSCALAVSINPRSRRALLASVSPLTVKVRQTVPVLLKMLDVLAEELNTARLEVEDKQRVLEKSIPRARKKSLKTVAQSVCLQAGVPLTIDELTREVLRAGYESKSSQLKYYLRRVLRQSDHFVCTQDGLWMVRKREGVLLTRV